MTEDKGILVNNLYHMLSYAFHILRQSNYEEIASETFENIQDLFATILAKGIAQQLKQGLYREYVLQHEDLSVMRGKLDLYGTIHNQLNRKTILACEYDELTENNVFNQILKTTAVILMQSGSVDLTRQTALKKVLLFFGDVDILDPSTIKWNTLRFQRNNHSYRMLLNVCYFVIEGLLLTTEKGNYKMATFLDEQHMSRLFEKFVLEYYRYHHPQLNASPKQIAWDADEESSGFLPVMNTDITLKHAEKTLIIDTKYYARAMQTHAQYGSHTLHSSNLYQILAYVKNKDVGRTGNVSGLLLYAKTNERISPDCDLRIGGNRIAVKTLDLNVEFSDIATQLNNIITSFF